MPAMEITERTARFRAEVEDRLQDKSEHGILAKGCHERDSPSECVGETESEERN